MSLCGQLINEIITPVIVPILLWPSITHSPVIGYSRWVENCINIYICMFISSTHVWSLRGKHNMMMDRAPIIIAYLISSQISDDDRMSLTTAVSDEEDGESVMASPYKAKTTGTAAASFNCTGAVRKAGFVEMCSPLNDRNI